MDSGGGGGGQQATNTSTTTSNIPDWAIPYATKNLGKAEALTDINQNPYQTYQGNRVANFNPLQNQAFSNVAGMQTNAGTGNAMNQTQDAYNRSANAGQYNAQNFGNQYGSGPQFQNMGLGYLSANAPNLNQYQMGPADQVSSQKFGQQDAQDYISPYQQNVTDFQKQEAVKDYSRQLPGMGAQASGAGAFGGTRHALVASEGQRNLQNQLGGIQAAGSQNAYQNAQQQFNADQARRQQSQMANQQAGLTVGQANLGSALQTQALGSGQSMQAQLANQGAYGQMQGLGMQQNLSANQQAMQNAQQRAQYGLAGQQAGEQSRQFGANYGLQNRQQALAAAGQLGTLGQQQYAQQMGINSAQQQAGAQMQAQDQQGLSNRYQDFLNQQNYPYKQLGFMSDIMRGTPTSGGAQSMYQAPPSGVSQLAGLGGGLGSLFGAYNAANRVATGGEIKGYAEGGTVALAEGGPTYGDVAPLPGIAALMAAKDIDANKSTIDKELGLGADLRKLMMASMQLKEQKEKDTIRRLQNQLAQATGMPSQQDTTVKEDVSNMLRQEVESSAAGNAPERQGGIAELDTGNLGENYNSGGIVAFEDGGNVRHFQEAGEVTSSPMGRLFSGGPEAVAERERERERINKVNADLQDVREKIAALGGNFGFKQQTSDQQKEYKDLIAQRENLFTQLNPLFKGADRVLSTVGEPEPTIYTKEPPPSPAPATNVGIRTPSPTAPAAESEDSGYTNIMNTLKGDRAKAIAMMESGVRSPETVLTAEEYAKRNLGEQNAYLKARGLPTAEESMKERIDNLATASKEARNNRDADRWMAAAQGFFAMAGGKSQYAMQNMAEGLGMGTKELRAVEQDYRKVDQLLKDKTELLKEATRQEARGDFAKGEVSRKEAEERNKGIADIKLKIGAHLLETFDRTAATATAAEGIRSSRADAAAGRRADTAARLAAKPYDIGKAYADAIDKVNLIPDPAERAKARAALDADFSNRVSTLNKNTESRDIAIRGKLAEKALEGLKLNKEYLKGDAALKQKMEQDIINRFGFDPSGGAAPASGAVDFSKLPK